MSSDVIISVEHLSKRYRLGQIGATSLREGAERLWHRMRGRDPDFCMAKVGGYGSVGVPAYRSGGKREDKSSSLNSQTPVHRDSDTSSSDPDTPTPPHSETSSSRSDDLWALRDVSFEVKRGEVLGIIGRNGAGKSTLLKILTRITEPTSGRAVLRGRVASLLEVGTGFHPELTGRENIFLNGAILGMRRAEIAAKFDEIVAFSEVEKFIDTPVKRYSSGMYVRLAFAVAAHLEPEILLVDEVLAVGDASFQKKCLGKMGEVAKHGRTILFVSHNMGAVSRLCGSAIWLDSGGIRETGVAMDLVSRYLLQGEIRSAYQIEPFQHNRGTLEARIVSAAVSDVNGVERSEFMIREPFALKAVYETTRDFPDGIAFWIIISSMEGAYLLAAHQNDVGYMPVKKGRHCMEMVLTRPALLPGSYSAMVGIFSAKHEFLDWVDGFQTVKIAPHYQTGRAHDGRWGQVEVDVEWRNKEL